MRATRAVIHLDHLRRNIRELKAWLGPQVKICMAVKADAYGHGAVPVAKAAREQGVDCLGIATVQEGEELRRAGLDCPLLLLGLPLPEELQALVSHGLTPLVASAEMLRGLQEAARSQGRRVGVHLKIDTGMGRIGCRPRELEGVLAALDECPGLTLAGVCTHFPVSDGADRGFTLRQIEIFKNCVEEIRGRGINPGLVHAANSGAIIGCPEAWFDMVRPGIMLYGYYPSDEQDRPLALTPVMELRTKVIFLKRVTRGTRLSYGLTYSAPEDTLIGTLPVGYADGYSRLLSNRGEVTIRGRRYPIAGRVCMDQCLVDLGPDARVELYEDVLLFGPAGPDAKEIGRLIGTIPYEVTCLVGKRVPRVYPDPGVED